MPRNLIRLTIPSLALTMGCGSSHMAGGDLGVTQGGSQDIGLAREIIEMGGIPDQEHFTSEGLFSEHDLPIDGEECEDTLCPRAASAVINPVDGSGQQFLVQLGFGTVHEAETFERRPLNLSIAVDVSGSMSGEKIGTVREAMNVMVNRLTEADTLSLIAFESNSRVLLEPTAMDEDGRTALSEAIDNLQAGGGTDIEAGLADAYSMVSPTADSEGVEDRVMLLTDAQPNTGGTGMDTFMGMARFYSAAGIGISVFGVGLDLGSELASEISNLPGGNSFYLADEEDIRQIFDEEFDYVVTPLGYNLDVDIAASEALSIGQTWATPSDPQDESIVFGASTLFLSARAGGMGMSLTFDEETFTPDVLADFDIAYEDLDGEDIADNLEVSFDGGAEYRDDNVQADDLGVYKMAYLIDMLIALESAADFCDGAIPLALANLRVGEAASRLTEAAVTLDDEELLAEAELIEKLAENLSQSTADCWEADAYLY